MEAVSKPVTVKIRIGYDFDSINCVEIAKLIEKAGASAIAVHGRTRSQMYEGHANWDYIRQVKEAVSIPVIGNGDVKTAQDAKRMLEETGCDIATVGMVFDKKEDVDVPANVKIVMGLREGETEGRCLYFTRAAAPFIRNPEKCKNKDFYHHIGIYVYKAESLKKFVELPVGVLEERESLEQLRALENGMTIRAKLVKELTLNKNAPADIDTPEDLEEARKWIK